MKRAVLLPISSFAAELQSTVASGKPAVLATIVRTIGSTYRKAGAAILVTSDGCTTGMLSGGCLEAEICREAESLMNSQAQSKLLHFDLSPDDDYLVGYGKGCSGQLWVLLEILKPGLMLTQHTPTQQTANAIILETSARIIVETSSQVHYEGLIDDEIGARIRETLKIQASTQRPFFDSFHTSRGEFISWCGWYSRPPIDLVVIGAGSDSIPLCTLAATMGWQVRICDHRPSKLNRKQFPNASALIQIAPDQIPDLQVATTTHVVIMSHNLIVDSLALSWAAEHVEINYIGLLGPSTRRERIFKILEADGKQICDKLRNRLRSPIGLDLGGRSEADIALSIVTQIQREWHAATMRDLTSA